MSMIGNSPFAKAMVAAGSDTFENAFTYQDYLYELFADGYNKDHPPISEQQWEYICDMKGKRNLTYASTSSTGLRNVERKNNEQT